VIHLYGLVQGLDELPRLTGVDGASLERRQIAGLDLVVSPTGTELPEVTDDAVLAHARVVEELMVRSRAILPARFGRAFASEEELTAAVETKAPALEHGLSRVRGCVEFGLRVLGREPTRQASTSVSGVEYMRARLDEESERDRLSEELHRPLAQLARANARFGGASGDLLHAAYLVPDEGTAAFRDRVGGLERQHSELTMVCTGPWPPYSFADAREDA
jgi:Gas vesicle synthesis protein GvpL/GvpF